MAWNYLHVAWDENKFKLMERSYKSFKHTGFSLCIKHEIVELKVFLPVGRNKDGFRRTAGSHGLIRPELLKRFSWGRVSLPNK
jgi:hypothetical protein